VLRTDYEAHIGKSGIRKPAEDVVQEWPAYGNHRFDTRTRGRRLFAVQGRGRIGSAHPRS